MNRTGYSKTAVKILEASLPLFAARGYNGVAMRDIAQTVGITAAALYNHFSGKETLYFKALEYAFADKVDTLSEALRVEDHPEDRLRQLITFWIEIFGGDVILRSLLQRELSDADEQRLRLLLDRVFLPVYEGSTDTLVLLSRGKTDTVLLFFAILGVVLSHFQLAPIRRRLPGAQPEHEDVERVATHLTMLLYHGLAPVVSVH
ncbi:MAG: TetR/AcrR family transcriptional regulator [Magnetococcales bacterium]|nr:TetR/AcrR family transcriptional regulator [Magnetococcales bacterium]MBF0260761.1 TetR/AcrR family transcriptional regulator [Magnetococcales bacterium]